MTQIGLKRSQRRPELWVVYLKNNTEDMKENERERERERQGFKEKREEGRLELEEEKEGGVKRVNNNGR